MTDFFGGEQILENGNWKAFIDNGQRGLSRNLRDGDIVYAEMFSILRNCADRGLRLNTLVVLFVIYVYLYYCFFLLFDF